MIEEAVFLESSNFSAKWVTIWFFVTGFFDVGILPPFEFDFSLLTESRFVRFNGWIVKYYLGMLIDISPLEFVSSILLTPLKKFGNVL